MHRALAALALTLGACATQSPAKTSARDEERAVDYATRADARAEQGDIQGALTLATRALVVRIASSGPEHPDVGRSFVQLGDLRWQNGQRGWAAQSYARALELFAHEPKRFAQWSAAARKRLAAVCIRVSEPSPACRRR